MASIAEIMQLCRLCLVKEQVNVPIFEEQGDIRQIFLKITACLPVKISREDNLPKKICNGCLYKLELLYQFWNTSTNAEKQLLSWLTAAGLDATTQTTQDAMAVVTQTQVVLKQEPNPEITENVTVVSDPGNFILQATQQPIEFPAVDFDYQDNFTAEQELANNAISADVDDSTESEPVAKRPRRTATATVTAPLIESEDDADDPGEAAVAAKTEEDSDDDTNVEPTFVDVAEDQDGEQPGPSGLGKIVEPSSKEDNYRKLYQKYKDVHKLRSCVVLLGDLSDVDPTVYTFFKKRPVTITSEVADENIVKGQRCKYKCEFCGKRFVDYASLDMHRTVHARNLDDSPEAKSASSDENYTSEGSASSSDEKVDDLKYHCKFCNRCFKYSYTYANHLKQHRHFICSKCLLKFNSQEQLEDHTKEAHKSVKCSKCPKEYETEAELNVHCETHKKAEDGDTWPCDICNMDLMDYDSLVAHNKDNHSLVCNLCDKEFPAFEQLTAHKYFAHINPLNKKQQDMERQRIEKKREQAKQQQEQQKQKELEMQKEAEKRKSGGQHTCNLCRKTFDNPKELESHESTHYSILTVATDNSQDEHKCTLCNKVCGNKEALSAHLKKHIVVHRKISPKPKPLESENTPSSAVTDKAVVATTKIPTSVTATATETFTTPKTTTIAPTLSISSPKMSTTIPKPTSKPSVITSTSSVLKTVISKSPVMTSSTTPIKFTTVATTESIGPTMSTISRKPVLKKIIVPPSSIITETTTVQAPPVLINPQQPQPQQRQLYVVNDKRCIIISQDQAMPTFKLITTDALQNKEAPLIATQTPLIHALPSIQPINNFLQPSINQTIVLPNSPTNSQISITNKTYNTAVPQEVNQGTTNIIYSPADPQPHKTYSRKQYVLTTTPQLVKVTNPSEILRSTTLSNANKSPRVATTTTNSDSKEKSYKPKIFLKPLSQLLEKPTDGSALPAVAPTVETNELQSNVQTQSHPQLTQRPMTQPQLQLQPKHDQLFQILEVPVDKSIPPASTQTTDTAPIQSNIQTKLHLDPQLQSKSQRPILPKPQLQQNTILLLQPQLQSQLNVQPESQPETMVPETMVQAVEEGPSTSAGQEAEDNSNDANSTADNSDDEKSDSSKSGIRKVYKCAVCKVTMRRSGKLLSHQTKYKCKVCKYTCCKLKILDNHYILKHDYKNRCASCDMQFPTNLELQMHKKVVHLCIKCNRCYFDLEKHKVSFKCLNCEFGACNAANLDAHYKLVHQITTRCAPCNIIFYDANQFQKHKEDVHFCDSCRTFKMDLNVHKTFCKGIKKDEEEIAVVEESNEVIEIDSE